MGKRRGHYCWCCDRIRANERFSGRGHRQHLCKDCKRLGTAEIAYRQAVRDIDRLRWRDQAKLEGIASTHVNDRVREYANRRLELWRRDQQERRELYEFEELVLLGELDELEACFELSEPDFGDSDENPF